MTFTYQYNDGKWTSEYIYSTHEALLGLTGTYNFGAKERMNDPSITSRLSLGGELFYAVLSKSPGISTCLRYTAQSLYTGTPLSLALLCNPLMGQISSMYSLSTRAASLGSRFDFNIYSYESDLSIGWEIWRFLDNTQDGGSFASSSCDHGDLERGSDTSLLENETLKDSLDTIKQSDATLQTETKEHTNLNGDLAVYSSLPDPPYTVSVEDGYISRKYKRFLNTVDRTLYDTGLKSVATDDPVVTPIPHSEGESIQDAPVFCFKGNTSLSKQTINLLWEGRFKELLISSGFGLSLQTKVPSVTTFGVEVQYSA